VSGATTLVAADASAGAVSGDGGTVVYVDRSDGQVYRWSRATRAAQIASVAADGSPAVSGAAAPSVSADGSRVAFLSNAPNLNPAHDDLWHAYVHDFASGKTTPVDVGLDGASASGEARGVGISPDGGFVAFTSGASNLVVGGDHNTGTDVYVRDLARGTTRLADVASSGTQADADADGGALSAVGSAGGGVVVFRSDATNLVPGDGNGVGDVFAHRLGTASTTPGATGPAPANGRVYYLHANDFATQSDLFWTGPNGGSETPAPGASNPAVSEGGPAVAPEGGRLAWQADVGTHGGDPTELVLGDRDGGRRVQLTDNNVYDGSASWSPDGRTIAFASDRDGTRGIYLLDVASRSVRMLFRGPEPADGPTFSPDGTQVAFDMCSDGNCRVWRIPVAGGPPVAVTAGPSDTGAKWGPDGRILFVRQVVSGVSYDVDVVDPATGAVSPVSSRYPRFAGLYNADPSWSPDGKRIAWVANGVNFYLDLFGVDVDGGGYRQLSADPLRHGFPSWAPAPAITAPLGGSKVAGAVTVAADPAPLDTGRVDFVFFDSRGRSHFLGTATAPAYTLSFDTRTVPNGRGTLRANATVAGTTYSVGEPLTVANAPATTLRLAVPAALSSVDPAGAGLTGNPALSYQLQRAACATLVAYPDAAAPRGQQLVPELADALPTVSADGRTYSFRVRSDFRWSPGADGVVTADDVRYSIERAVRLDSYAASLLDVVAGEQAYVAGTAPSISGISVDGSLISFTLTAPHGDFPSRLALPLFCPVPAGSSPTALSPAPLPSAGPYYVTDFVPGSSIVLKPNPGYAGPRPRRWSEIDVALGLTPADALAQVEGGAADYDPGPYPAGAAPVLQKHYGDGSPAALAGKQRFFLTPSDGVRFLALNTVRPFFADLRHRRAVAYALDRSALADAWSPGIGAVTDQLLPSPLPGFRDLTLFADTPDLAAALAALGTAGGGTVTLGVPPGPSQQAAEILTENLAAIGITVVEQPYASFGALLAALKQPESPLDLAMVAWAADYPDPANVFEPLFHSGGTALFPYSGYDAQLDAASPLRLGSARDDAYAAIDQSLSSDLPAVAFQALRNADMFSPRIGCQVPQPFFGMDLVALCDRASVPQPDSVSATLSADPADAAAASTVPVGDVPPSILSAAQASGGAGAAPIENFPIENFPIENFPIENFPIENFGFTSPQTA
ncbi:MAG TPA: ABC transporter substrate-binding protein, partial [Gaiellaceae bacterium]